LWLENADPSELNKMPLVVHRLENIRKFRANSTKESVKRQASTPALFSEIRQPKDNYIIIPRHSSENRKYIPLGFFNSDVIASDSCIALPNATLFHFGVLTSAMHMAWVSHTCGRLESRFRYSNVLVYNNFIWPENISEKQIRAIEKASQKILDVRAEFPNSSLAHLYNPLTMPPTLVKAHQDLDKAVDLAYRSKPFTIEAKRIEFLFELYEKHTADLFTKEKPKKTKKTA